MIKRLPRARDLHFTFYRENLVMQSYVTVRTQPETVMGAQISSVYVTKDEPELAFSGLALTSLRTIWPRGLVLASLAVTV